MLRDEITRQLKCRLGRIVSDGDWDGVTATALLVKYAKEHNIDPVISYPHPRDLKNLSFNYVVSVEITPTKAEIRNSIIFDHHEKIEGFNNIWIFDANATSVASLVSNFLNIPIDKEFLEAIDAIDQGKWEKSELSKLLFLGYQVDPASFPRMEITYLIANDEIDKIISWAENKSKSFEKLMARAKNIKDAAFRICDKPLVLCLIYRIKRDEGARRIALIELEKQADIAIALGVENECFITGTIATMKNITLTPLYAELRKLGYNAGGRGNVGGFQDRFNRPINDVITDLKNILNAIFKARS